MGEEAVVCSVCNVGLGLYSRHRGTGVCSACESSKGAKRVAEELAIDGLEYSVYLAEDEPKQLHQQVFRHRQVFDTPTAALRYAFDCCMAHDGGSAYIDVLTWNRKAAVAYAGSDGGKTYDEDPDASAFERILIQVRSKGRIA